MCSGLFGLPRWLSGKDSACQCRSRRFNPWVGKIPGGGNGNPFQYSCLENPMHRGAWKVWGCKELDMIEHSTLTQGYLPGEPSPVLSAGGSLESCPM